MLRADTERGLTQRRSAAGETEVPERDRRGSLVQARPQRLTRPAAHEPKNKR